MGVAFGEYEFDPIKLELSRRGAPVSLNTTELRLLGALLAHPGQLVSKSHLIDAVWQGRAVTESAITVAVARLRKTLLAKRGEPFIHTVRGRGYRFSGLTSVLPEPGLRSATDYVGRAGVQALLHQGLDAARAGRGQIMLLIGEPGIGKTRAVEMLERERPDGVRSAWGLCREAGDTPPLSPWQELLSEIGGGRLRVDHQPSDSASGSGADAARHQAFARAAASLLEATRGTTWLLVLDDLHRADAASLELLLHVADQIHDARIFIVATLRPYHAAVADGQGALLARVLEHPRCASTRLERLSSEDVARFVAASGVEDPHGEVARAIYRKSEGNPFFMTELLRQLGGAGDALRPEALKLTSAALDLMRQRVEGVDQQLRGLISVGAVIGGTLALELLAEVVEDEPQRLRAQLEEALRCEVLVAVNESTLRFGHELIRTVLYEGLDPTRRRAWHERVGRVLERRRATHAISASEIAFHYHAALPGGDLETTVRICREAADEAAAVFGSADVAHYTHYALQALRLLARPSLRLQMSLLYGMAVYSRSYDTATYARCAEELIELARQCRSGEMLARACALLDVHPRLEPLPRTAAPLELALTLLPADAHALRALVHASLAALAPHCYDAARCLPLVRKAGELAEAAMQAEGARAGVEPAAHEQDVPRASGRGRHAYYTALLQQLYLDAGEPATTQRVLARLEEMAQRSPVELATLPIDLAFHRASVALTQGAIDQAESALLAARGRAQQLAHAELLWHGERALALLRVESAGDAAALEALRKLHRQATAQGLLGTAVFCAFDRAVYLAATDASGEQALALQPQEQDRPGLWALKVRGLVAAGALHEAREALARVKPEQLAALPFDGDYLGSLGHLTRAALVLEERAYYPALAALLSAHAQAFALQLFGGCSGSVAQLLGMLALRSEQPQLAIPMLERALEQAQGAGLRVCALETRLWLTRALLASDEARLRRRAATLIRGARADAEDVLVGRIRRDIEQLLGEVQRAL